MLVSKLEKDNESDQIIFEDCKVIEIIETATNACDKLAKSKNINLELSCNESFMIKANPLLLKQAITNLVNNAIKYSNKGKSIFISVLNKQNETIIGIQDQGIGIPDEHIDHIFERFYRIDKSRSRKTGGSGLGLSIVKLIAETHGGYIKVDSKLGVGSTFLICLPKV